MGPSEPTSSVILYCRAGFEGECAQEISARASGFGIFGHVRALRDSAFVEFVAASGSATDQLSALADTRAFIFARQALRCFASMDQLPVRDRITPILAMLREHGARYGEVLVEAPDTNDGKALAPFCKSFGSALAGAMKKARLIDPAAAQRLHAFFPQGDKVYLCTGDPARSSPWPQGIPRLKFPREAPSRSTLKLDEAFLVLLDDEERERWLKPGMSAVDLGAAPGGWTWQLVRRSLRVAAIDNGPMDPALMQSGLVTHVRADGFRWRPPKPVDWLVCDMVEQPRRVATLIAQWLGEGLCRHAIFNLKLPMKKRYDETRLCLDIVHEALGPKADIRAKQLYHDREEITVFARRA
ncbi:MAG: 23S rRNA (cytidine(2498)-2'-O)-methyltransferase RlmM [Proteobacteria bacterium]|uniref:23S rRNA (cytidine(2498)-2'-O)-methyltransferase RlmM n=1 Tax=Rudaea sp. TaxID=2136325 RepID=UPI00321FA726|nr:23S rRNA (cytidine(2498)-2'-O)-methyltransferase RlmM [Pseudomonadota bacterium]